MCVVSFGMEAIQIDVQRTDVFMTQMKDMIDGRKQT
jgi:hypothetical protein